MAEVPNRARLAYSSAKSKYHLGDHVQNPPSTTIDSALVNEIESFERSYPCWCAG